MSADGFVFLRTEVLPLSGLRAVFNSCRTEDPKSLGLYGLDLLLVTVLEIKMEKTSESLIIYFKITIISSHVNI